jgi:hypothetical protein
MAMNPKLLRPKASGVHPEAAAWKTAVVANGGSVSGTTLSAVDKFCKAIDTAGIRDRFYRLNPLCGTGLNACLVPLFRGPSLGGTQYGNTTDTNTNFVSGDYSTTSGLTGDGTTKYLKTGLASSSIDGGLTGHCSLWRGTGTVATVRIAMGGSDNDVDDFEVQERTAATAGAWGKTTFITSTPGNVAGLKMINRSASNRLDLYVNGTSASNSTSTITVAAHNNEFYVCAGNRNGTATLPIALPVFMYSIGLSMTSTQASAFYTAASALNTALGR